MKSDNLNVDHKMLVKLIDDLAPLNNLFRIEKDAIIRIELLWEFGKLISEFLKNGDLKLHKLLYILYDPHSTVKMTYITRDVGSYSYRIFNFFKNKDEIKTLLCGLTNYNLFRESIPLLFNPKYNLNDQKKKEVFELITSGRGNKNITNEIKKLKQEIRPIKNPRNQKANLYFDLKDYLSNLFIKVKTFYKDFAVLPEEAVINSFFGSKDSRNVLVPILMVLASDSFHNKLEDIDLRQMPGEYKKLLEIAGGSNEDRARFRKWVMSANDLLKFAEAIHVMNNEDDFKSFRLKLTQKSGDIHF